MGGIKKLFKTMLVRVVRDAAFWQLNLLVWFGVGSAVFLVRWMFHHDPVRALVLTLVGEMVGMGLSFLLHPVYRRAGLAFEMRTAMVIVGCSLGASLLVALLTRGFVELTGWYMPGFTPLEGVFLQFILLWIVFMGWSFGYFWLKTGMALHGEARVAALAVDEARRMELETLRARLDPHFLFNSLNAVATLIPTDPSAAIQMVRKMAEYLRYSLERRRSPLAFVSEEVSAARSYLEVERVRFGSRLVFDFEVDAVVESREVPSFLLQPLVENAIKHGLHASEMPMRLGVRISDRGETLCILVENTGRLRGGPDGVGLATLRRRLELHYPGRHVFLLHQVGEVVRAELELRGTPCCVS